MDIVAATLLPIATTKTKPPQHGKKKTNTKKKQQTPTKKRGQPPLFLSPPIRGCVFGLCFFSVSFFQCCCGWFSPALKDHRRPPSDGPRHVLVRSPVVTRGFTTVAAFLACVFRRHPCRRFELRKAEGNFLVGPDRNQATGNPYPLTVAWSSGPPRARARTAVARLDRQFLFTAAAAGPALPGGTQQVASPQRTTLVALG